MSLWNEPAGPSAVPERPCAELIMIGILTTLSLTLPLALPARAPESAAAGARPEPTQTLVEALQRASVERQRGGEPLPWSDVDRGLSALVGAYRAGSAAGPRSREEAAELGQLLCDLAIGTTPFQRLELVLHCRSLLDLGFDGAARERLIRTQVRLLEPLVSRTADEDARDSVLERGIALYESIEAAVTDPLTGEAPDFLRRSRLRIERLKVGQPMPRFVARDTAGNELRSAQLEGRVLVLRFWDPASAASLAAHRTDAAWVREYWDASFDLIGVATNEDRDAYLAQLEQLRFGGVQLFDGPISTALADALARQQGGFSTAGEFDPSASITRRWGLPVPGSQFIVDARGRIRGRDLAPGATRVLVEQLLLEEQSRRRQQLGQSAGTR